MFLGYAIRFFGQHGDKLLAVDIIFCLWSGYATRVLMQSTRRYCKAQNDRVRLDFFFFLSSGGWGKKKLVRLELFLFISVDVFVLKLRMICRGLLLASRRGIIVHVKQRFSARFNICLHDF